MASVIWLTALFLIFWLVTLLAMAWLCLFLLRRQSAQEESTRRLLQESWETERERLQDSLTQEHTSSTESLDLARAQTEDLLDTYRQATREAVSSATLGVSSANQSLTKLMERLIPILAAKDAVAAGQLSTLTAPAEERQELHGVPYTAENEAIVAQIDEAMAYIQSQGVTDANTARTAAASVLLPPI